MWKMKKAWSDRSYIMYINLLIYVDQCSSWSHYAFLFISSHMNINTQYSSILFLGFKYIHIYVCMVNLSFYMATLGHFQYYKNHNFKQFDFFGKKKFEVFLMSKNISNMYRLQIFWLFYSPLFRSSLQCLNWGCHFWVVHSNTKLYCKKIKYFIANCNID